MAVSDGHYLALLFSRNEIDLNCVNFFNDLQKLYYLFLFLALMFS